MLTLLERFWTINVCQTDLPRLSDSLPQRQKQDIDLDAALTTPW
jgi:hypothetical protein